MLWKGAGESSAGEGLSLAEEPGVHCPEFRVSDLA